MAAGVQGALSSPAVSSLRKLPNSPLTALHPAANHSLHGIAACSGNQVFILDASHVPVIT